MQLEGRFAIVVALAVSLPWPATAQTPDDDLKIYAVNVVKTPPLEKQFNGYGIYVGKGLILTAAHVVGRWPSLTHPHVHIAGLDVPVRIVKQGSLEQTDLALLSVDEALLPVTLAMRRNPLCKLPLPVRANVIVAYPNRTVRSHIISPLAISPRYRAKYSYLISEQQGSGSGVFDADRKCLLGIMSMRVPKYNYRYQNGRWYASPAGYAGYYVPASAISDFFPPELRF